MKHITIRTALFLQNVKCGRRANNSSTKIRGYADENSVSQQQVRLQQYTFATGTPISNSMVEFYVMQRYLRPDLLEKAGLQNFDDWASTFGEVVSQLEIKPAGNGFQMKNRFSKFVNIPELMQMYKEFADIQTADMLKLPVPKLETGKPIVVTSKPDERQKHT